MQDQVSCQENEYSRLLKIINFRLAPSFKKIGLIGAIFLLSCLIISKFLGIESLIGKDVLRTLVLLFMLMASMSKDSLEDEFNKHIRLQSYALAFACSAIYAITLPLIAIVLDWVITAVTGDGQVSFYEVSAFEVLFMLMGLQILFFHTIKKLESAE